MCYECGATASTLVWRNGHWYCLLHAPGMPEENFKEKMSCPDDLSEWVNDNHDAMWFVYDLNLMPEQITNRGEVCALRGFRCGWEARGRKEEAERNAR